MAVLGPVADGVLRLYKDRSGNLVALEVRKLATPAAAHSAWTAWDRQYTSRSNAIKTVRGNWASSKFRSEGMYYHGWQAGEWMIVIRVPEQSPNADELRNDLHDHLLQRFKYML